MILKAFSYSTWDNVFSSSSRIEDPFSIIDRFREPSWQGGGRFQIDDSSIQVLLAVFDSFWLATSSLVDSSCFLVYDSEPAMNTIAVVQWIRTEMRELGILADQKVLRETIVIFVVNRSNQYNLGVSLVSLFS